MITKIWGKTQLISISLEPNENQWFKLLNVFGEHLREDAGVGQAKDAISLVSLLNAYPFLGTGCWEKE